ncbi:MAG TPA: SPFH domain-containing protein [Bryobacteraceae bacterium]|nr:SPFH domain-containing protein [Bryobacteraceae bacterium]
MDPLVSESSRLMLPLIVLAVGLALLIAAWLFSRNYLKVAPNVVAVLSGRKRKLSDGRVVGYRMVKGGAALKFPLLEKVDYLSLNVMTIPLEIKRAYTGKGVPVCVKAVANVKIRSDDMSLQAAAERFLGMTHDQMQRVIFQTLEGHLRSILGTLTVEEINCDRQSFAQKLTSEAAADLEKMGLGVDVLTIQEISDEEGYLDALGKRRTAEVKRDATIGEAEATRDAKIKSSVALQEGEQAKFAADAEIALARRDFSIRQAQYEAEVETQHARAKQAGPLAEAQARQAVIAEEVKVERTRVQENISVQEQEVLRRQKELDATVIKPAVAEREAQVTRAEASQRAAILKADGERAAMIAMAQAQQQKLTQEGLGRAAAVEAEGKAEAFRIEVQGKAEASKVEAIGLAQAKAIEAQGVAEAAAILRKAEAWKEFNEAARLQTILEKLPAIIQASTGVFGAVAAPMGNIDKIVVIDQGGGDGSSSGVTRLAKAGPSVVFGLLQQLEALGLNVPAMVAQLGLGQSGQKIEVEEVAKAAANAAANAAAAHRAGS